MKYVMCIPNHSYKYYRESCVNMITFAHTFMPQYSPFKTIDFEKVNNAFDDEERVLYYVDLFSEIETDILLFSNKLSLTLKPEINDLIARNLDSKDILFVDEFLEFYDFFCTDKDSKFIKLNSEQLIKLYLRLKNDEITLEDLSNEM